MRVVFFDCFSKISGEMILGALLDLGIDTEVFKTELRKLGLDGYHVNIQKKDACGILATNFEVFLQDLDYSVETTWQDAQYVSPNPTFSASANRENTIKNLLDLEALIDGSGMRLRAKILSKQIFREIIRNNNPFHKGMYEVQLQSLGNIETIVAIVGVAISLDLLGVDLVFSSPIRRQEELEISDEAFCVLQPHHILTQDATDGFTMIGLGILKTLSKGFGVMPKMFIEGVGYGLGKSEAVSYHALRVIIGSLFEESCVNSDINIVEAKMQVSSS